MIKNHEKYINEGLGKFLKIWGKVMFGMKVSNKEVAYATPGFVDFDTPFKQGILTALKRAKTYEDLMSIYKDIDYFGDRISIKTHTDISNAFEKRAKELGLWREDND
jgi:hypothetical protein